MAKFNPDLPLTQDPNYLNYSHAAQKPDADLTLGTLFSGIGSVISDVAKGAKLLSERAITQGIHERADPVRDDFIDQLQGTVNKLAQANPAQAAQNVAGPLPPQIAGSTAAGDTSSTDVLPYAEEEAAKPNIQGALAQIKQLNSAKQVKPELRTYYDGRMLAIAREMRNLYPGQIDFIDQKISEITGGNPANKMVTDLLSSIQSYVAGSGNVDGKIQSAIIAASKSGDLAPDIAPQVWNYYNTTKDVPGTLAKISSAQAAKQKFEAAKRNHELSGMSREDSAMTAIDALTRLAGDHSANVMDVAVANLNIAGRQIRSGKDLFNLVQDIQLGKVPFDTKDAVRMAQGVEALKTQTAAYLWQQATEGRRDGFSVQQRIDAKYPNRTKQIINDSLTMFDTIRDNIMKGDISLAGTNIEWQKLATSDKVREIMENKDIGQIVTLQSALEKISPNIVQTYYQRQFENSGMTGLVNKYFQYEAMKFGAQQDPNNPATIKSAIDRAKTVFPDLSETAQAKLNNNIINTMSILKDKKVSDDVKLNQVTAAFDPSMKGFIRTIPGADAKNSVFRKFTSKDVLDEVLRLDQAHPDQNVLGRYRNWMEETFAVDLAHKAISNVNEALRQPGVQIKWTPPTATTSGRFDAAPSRDINTSGVGSRYNQVDNNYVNNTQKILNGLNYNLQSVTEFAKATGQDPETYILQLLSKTGINIQQELNNPRGSLVRAIVASKMSEGRGTKINTNSKVGE